MQFATTAKDFLTKETHITTGCSKIDEFLRGGISGTGITQIYGEAGTGKTQLALQLCLSAQISLKNTSKRGVLYICTGSAFPSRRLEELLKHSAIAKKYQITSDLIFVEHVTVVENLEDCILNSVPKFAAKNSIALLIIDSIAAPYRVEYKGNELRSRAKSFRTIGQALHNFSSKNNIPIVCINQVSAGMGTTKGLCQDLQPVLGVTWACQVTNSLYFCKINGQRHIHIRESSYLPRKILLFNITQFGVNGFSILQ